MSTHPSEIDFPEENLAVATEFPFISLTRLATVVIASRPAYAPEVIDGTVHVQQWLWAKEPSWRRALMTPDNQMVGYVGVRPSRAVDDLELVRLMVHPDWQRRGLATRLIDLAVDEFGTRLSALVGPGYPAHRLLLGLGWTDIGTTIEPGGECVVMACPSERRSR